MRHLIATTLLTASLATPAFAANWQVDPKTSSITFSAEQSGETFGGSFPTYDAHITLDPANPKDATIHIAINVADVNVEGEDRQGELPGEEWFDVKTFPKAEFTSSGVTKNADGSYVANGTLAIKDVKKNIAIPFTLNESGNHAVAKGSFSLNRTDYHVGTGEWVSDEWIKFPVTVSFTLNATKS